MKDVGIAPGTVNGCVENCGTRKYQNREREKSDEPSQVAQVRSDGCRDTTNISGFRIAPDDDEGGGKRRKGIRGIEVVAEVE